MNVESVCITQCVWVMSTGTCRNPACSEQMTSYGCFGNSSCTSIGSVATNDFVCYQLGLCHKRRLEMLKHSKCSTNTCLLKLAVPIHVPELPQHLFLVGWSQRVCQHRFDDEILRNYLSHSFQGAQITCTLFPTQTTCPSYCVYDFYAGYCRSPCLSSLLSPSSSQ